MRLIGIEEHWSTAAIDEAQRALSPEMRDDSVQLSERGEIPQRLGDLGDGRIAAMDDAGVAMQILSLTPPGTNGLAPQTADRLAREANDRVSRAVEAHPRRLRALSTLPWSDPELAVAELERTTGSTGHVGVMAYPRCGDRRLDDPAFDEVLATAARLGRPILVHPQIPSRRTRAELYDGLGDPLVELGLATFGWGWHLEAGTAALRLILAGAFDRHPDLQIVLGHWGEMLLFALDRANGLSAIAATDRPVRDYFASNVHITVSGMLDPRLLRHALELTDVTRILLSFDSPFHSLDSAACSRMLGVVSDPADRERIAHGNAEALFDLTAGAGPGE